jgi:hypothetical protein
MQRVNLADQEMYSQLEEAYQLAAGYRNKVQFKIAEFRNCIFVSDENRSFVVDLSMGIPYILFEA